MLEILKYPHPLLGKKCNQVVDFNDNLKLLIKHMFQTMYVERGLGLSANQIGQDKQVFVMDVENVPLAVINPEIIWRSKEISKGEEGCLSFPGFIVDVERHEGVIAKFQDENGAWREKSFSGLSARCFQHENEHLQGQTFVMHLSKAHRDLIKSKMFKKSKKSC